MTLKIPKIKVSQPSKLVLISALALIAVAVYDGTIEINLCE